MQAMEVVWGRCCVVVKGQYAGDDNGHFSGIYPSNELLFHTLFNVQGGFVAGVIILSK